MPKQKLILKYTEDVSKQLDMMYEPFKDDPHFLKEWGRLSYNVASLKEVHKKVLSGVNRDDIQEEIRLAYQNPAYETYLAKNLRESEFEKINQLIIEHDISVVEIFIKTRLEELEKFTREEIEA